MFDWYCWLSWSLVIVVSCYILFELHYFWRMALCLLLARFIKRKCQVLDTTIISGVCLSNDLDHFLCHMNNARYLREMDFARVDFYERTKLYHTIRKNGGSIVQGATTIRYRKFIRPFRRFYITSKIIYWDSQSIFMEHRFLRPKDQFIHCIAICRQRIIGCSVDAVLLELLTRKSLNDTISVENGEVVESKLKPEPTEELQKWIQYNEISSRNLRQNS
ncbi:protein THEM6 [Glossina fuscipes]|uniref:Protein THEM6 n=1 Tax=Glossina fuscipes TaxID=7396 RepID=A0A8U0W8G3_9MUSC|nr:protein THEM6 [Glossina fuscipes]